MNPELESRSPNSNPQSQERWVKIAFYVAILLLVGWLYASEQSGIKPAEQPNAPPSTKSTADTRPRTPSRPPQPSRPNADSTGPNRVDKTAEHPDVDSIVHNARVTNEAGHVIYRGDIDLQPTLDRIQRGKRLRFSHDGIVFENRERRLPQKPTGYYHEFVHPTPGDDGPGGQRVVLGREGEIYYSPDHYHTFRRVN